MYFDVFYKYFAPGRRPQGFFLKNDVIYVYLCIFMYFLCILMHFGGPWAGLGPGEGSGRFLGGRELSSTAYSSKICVFGILPAFPAFPGIPRIPS